MRRDHNMIRSSDLVIPATVARRRDGTIIDLTGATVVWRIGPINRLSTSIQTGIGESVTVVSAAAGTYSRNLAASLTAHLEPDFYRHSVKVVESDGSETIVENGYIELERNLP